MFLTFKKLVDKQIEKINKTNAVFKLDVSKDELWDTYINSFPEEGGVRQSYNCNCCKNFVKNVGGLIGLNDKAERTYLWDVDINLLPERYHSVVKALKKLTEDKPIESFFYTTEHQYGTEKSVSKSTNTIWNHFVFRTPSSIRKNIVSIGALKSEKEGDIQVLGRGLEDISLTGIDTIMELIETNSLYRGDAQKSTLTAFRKLKVGYDKSKNKSDFVYFWVSNELNKSALRIRNTSLGQLLLDVSDENCDLEKAVASYERMVAPTNYRRTTSVVSKKQIEDAKKKLSELGYLDSLQRRQISTHELSVNEALYIHRTSEHVLKDVFGEVMDDVPVKPKNIKKVEDISIDDFISKVVPTAREIRLFLDNKKLNNFVTLVGKNNKEDKGILNWDNSVSWSYTGGVTDSIKQRVKDAGGDVDVDCRVSLAWANSDDLDLSVTTPRGNVIYFSNKRDYHTDGVLDVDMNVSGENPINPVENIRWKHDSKMTSGSYKVRVHQYTKRNTKTDFDLEIDFRGKRYSKSFTLKGHEEVVYFSLDKDPGSIKVNGLNEGPLQERIETKWGIDTQKFHTVNAITFSPNHWGETKVGAKHFFFLLEGAESDEKIRPFYDEFLNKDILEHRRVLEQVAGKLDVKKVPSELSGVGFIASERNEALVEVTTGKIKRNFNIKF